MNERPPKYVATLDRRLQAWANYMKLSSEVALTSLERTVVMTPIGAQELSELLVETLNELKQLNKELCERNDSGTW